MHAFFCFPYPLYTSTVAQFKCFTKSNWIVFVARITISPNKLNAILIYSKSTLYWLTIDRSCNPFHRFHSYFYDPFFVFHSDKCEFQTFFFSLSLSIFLSLFSTSRITFRRSLAHPNKTHALHYSNHSAHSSTRHFSFCFVSLHKFNFTNNKNILSSFHKKQLTVMVFFS